MKTCNECHCVRWEDWPKGVLAARCMNEYRPQSGIIPKGRVLITISDGKKLKISPPSWCPYNGERRKK